jgi:RimJ/RimL family protein N-acetyltransferase
MALLLQADLAVGAGLPERADDRRRVFVAEDTAGALIGAASIDDHGHLAYAVAAQLRGRGYGGEMVRLLCRQAAREGGVEWVRAQVARENIASRRILERQGFAFDGLIHPVIQGRRTAVLNYALRLASRVSQGTRPAQA